MSRLPLLMAALLIGGGLAMQAGANANLRVFTGSPFRTALVNFIMGGLVSLVIVLFTGGNAPRLGQSSWWMWLGGLFGMVFVVGGTALSPRLGATTWAAAVVAGQLTAAVVIDNWGWLGYRLVPLTWTRVLGIALLLVGVLLIQRGR